MRILDALLFAMGTALIAPACTVSAGSGEFTDTDETDTDFFGDVTEDETEVVTETETEDEPTDGVMTDATTDTTVTDTTTDDTATDETPTDATDAGGGELEDSGTIAECPTPEGDCFQCMAADCTTAFTLCNCDEECSAAFAAMQQCYADKNYSMENVPDSAEEFADCQALKGEQGSLLADLAACVEAPYMGEEETDTRFMGDGTCTFACYGLITVDLL